MKNCKDKNCKHYKKSERIGIKVCEFDLHESYCEKDKEDFAIEELEKIKQEVEEEKIDIDLNIGQERLYNNAINDVMQIIDKYIAELKGE